MRSRIDSDGSLSLSLETVELGEPAEDEVVVRVEAAPINPSDLGMMLGPADLSTLERGEGLASDLRFRVPQRALASVSGRLGQSMPLGNEGAGTVIAAGRDAAHLEGKRVGMLGGAMYADYRRIKAREVIELPSGTTAADGAAMFVNPLTALGFVETARSEGHGAIVHTAAASNLGQMLQKICIADGIPLINIVRSPAQAELLREIGATHVLDNNDADFVERLTDAITQTGATVAFDAIGGGTLGSRILQSMERAALAKAGGYSRYGSTVFKELYIYGILDMAPTSLHRLHFGYEWRVSGWLLTPFLRKIGPEAEQRLRARVVDELMTTFASHYTRVIGLAEALEPGVLRAYERKATGEKYLIDPTRG
jgi:NADPH:quinone reductase-like Zn-dependent oxidoreductase